MMAEGTSVPYGGREPDVSGRDQAGGGDSADSRSTRSRPETSGGGTESEYRLWVNEARTVLVRLWKSGTVEVATRESSGHTWGPPVICDEERE